jgi:hypothetical protein
MVVIGPNLEYDLYGAHTFTNPFSSSTPSIQLIHLLQDGLVKLCDNDQCFFAQLLAFLLEFNTSVNENLSWRPKHIKSFIQKNMMPLHCYDLAMAPTKTTWKNV